jgi:membrane protein implicated in regulation of membrane protease activity
MQEQETPDTQPVILPQRKRSMMRIGFILVVLSYVLLAPTFVFIALGLHHKAWFWCRLAAATYVLNWVLFAIGFLLAGHHAVRSGHRWFRDRLRRKREPSP